MCTIGVLGQARVHLSSPSSGRRMVEESLGGKKIVQVCAVEAGGGPRSGEFDGILFANCESAAEVEGQLTGRSVLSVHRVGKHMWMQLDGDGMQPCFHFGMTGSFVVKGGCVLASAAV